MFAPSRRTMSGSPRFSATILICTYNRAALLGETLASLRAVRSAHPWDVIVVDNNSVDDTREVVEEAAVGFPVPLLYVFEARQGKSYALNTGIDAAAGDVLLFTDDDVRVDPGWVEAACEALDPDRGVLYCGGPVRPIWGAAPPRWLDQQRGDLWGTLAILDYGGDPFIFEERRKVPLGANMAVHRTLIDRIGGFNVELGRKGGSLLGQEQAEFFSRAREDGATGRYAPAMAVEHHVPEARLGKRYFRRWWYWKGVSRARMDLLHPVTELGVDLRRVPHWAGVPRFMFTALPALILTWLQALARRQWTAAARDEMLLCYTMGYIRARWAHRPRTASKWPTGAPKREARQTRSVALRMLE
jgi:glycosyltransferase involved in cell wall biosynthesis